MITATNFFINILLAIDSGIYWLAAKAYELLLAIAEVQIFDNDTIRVFGERIYILLGIFMLFKVSFSLIKYIVSPDDFTDNNKGIGNLIKNTLICLLLIVAVPYIFNFGRDLQQAVLTENVIPNLILGMGAQSGETIEYGAEGEEVAFLTFSSFFVPNKAIFQDNGDCRQSVFENAGTGNENISIKEECAEIINQSSGSSYEDEAEVYETAFQYSNIYVLTDSDLFKSMSTINGEKVRTFDYKFIVSTLAGAFLAWIFVMFCFDVAVRTIKLVFLQLIAPIPIISYIEPKGRDGIFKKWVRESIKTYLDLFIRLIAIFFAIFIISKIGSGVIDYGERGYDTLVFIFIIFGTLLFAKQIPKLIENIAGVKLDGGFTLNPMNKIRQTPIVSHLGSTTAGLVAGAFAGAKGAQELGQKARWGAWRGALYGRKEGSRKIGWTGGDGKRADVMSSASNKAMRELTGHDFAQFSALKYIGQGKAREEIDRIKKAKKAFGQAINSKNEELNTLQNNKTFLQEEMNNMNKRRQSILEDVSKLRSEISQNPNDSSGNSARLSKINDLSQELTEIRQGYNNNIESLNTIKEEEREIHGKISEYNRSIEKLNKIQSKREIASGIPEQNIDDLNKLLKDSENL